MRVDESRKKEAHCALHLKPSDVSAVSRPSAPATAVPPSFPRSFELRQAEGAR